MNISVEIVFLAYSWDLANLFGNTTVASIRPTIKYLSYYRTSRFGLFKTWKCQQQKTNLETNLCCQLLTKPEYPNKIEASTKQHLDKSFDRYITSLPI